MKTNPEQQKPTPGKQASVLRQQLQAAAIDGSSPRLMKALALAAKIAEEEEKGMPDFIKEKIEQKDDKPAEEKKEDKKAAEKVAEKKDDKKASHGFDLSAE
jgi:hypothetical protein